MITEGIMESIRLDSSVSLITLAPIYNILIKGNGLEGSNSYTRYRFSVCPLVDKMVTKVLNEKFASGLKYLPEDVLAKYNKRPGSPEYKMRYMRSDWTINNNCMTFTFSVIGSAAVRVGKDKSCERAESNRQWQWLRLLMFHVGFLLHHKSKQL